MARPDFNVLIIGGGPGGYALPPFAQCNSACGGSRRA